MWNKIKKKIQGFQEWMQERNKVSREREMKYWGGVLGKKFENYDQMCGARDLFKKEMELKEQKNNVTTTTTNSIPQQKKHKFNFKSVNRFLSDEQ